MNRFLKVGKPHDQVPSLAKEESLTLDPRQGLAQINRI
jgi:hypothetical protein